MPPPGYEPFLRAICADPEDDTVRLAYADWLDENGDPDRAEFIRASIACHRAFNHPKNPGCRRAKESLKHNSGRWRSEVPRLEGIDWAGFERGFIHRLSIRDHKAFPASLRTAFGITPINHIKICHCRPWMLSALVAVPGFRSVQYIDARAGYVDDDSLANLATSPFAGGLARIDLSGEAWATTLHGRERMPLVTDKGAEALALSTSLSRLKSLALCRTDITSRGWELLRSRYKFVYEGREFISPPDPPPGSPSR
jgi:uncharacterized protein (TIGR02996 family)